MSKNSPLVIWQEKYALGMPEIDDQHRMLFDIMNKVWDGIIRNADSSIMEIALEDLERYTMLHFTEEEIFMRNINYPHFNQHVFLHQKFVERISNEKNKAQQGQKISLELLHFLRDWLVNHILVEDRRYVELFHKEQKSKSLLSRFFGRFK